MKTEDILAKTQEAFHEAFSVDPLLISLETRPEDVPGWDSLGQLALATSLEQRFGISLDVDDLMEMESVFDIVRILHSKQEP
jgi:acyl carrier protein